METIKQKYYIQILYIYIACAFFTGLIKTFFDLEVISKPENVCHAWKLRARNIGYSILVGICMPILMPFFIIGLIIIFLYKLFHCTFCPFESMRRLNPNPIEQV